MNWKKKTGCFLAGLALAATLAGCNSGESTGDTHKKPVESLPVVVANDTPSSPLVSGADDTPACNEEGILCGTLVNNVFEDKDKTFRITVPEGWKLQENTHTHEGDFLILLSSTGDSSLEIKRQENDPNLLAYTQKEFEEVYAQGLQNLKIQKFEQITIQNHRTVHLAYTSTNKEVTYRFDQYIILGDFDYNFTYVSSESSADLSADFTQSIQSFQETAAVRDVNSNNGKLVGSVYTAFDGSYTISLPSGWRMTTAGENPLAKSADKKSNVNILVSDLDKDLLTYNQSYFEEYYASLFSSVKITTFQKTTVGGLPALHIVCSYQYNGKNLTASQYRINGSKNTYAVTYTAPSDLYNSLSASFQTSAASFRAS